MNCLIREHKWAGLCQAVFLLSVVAMMGNLTASTVHVMLLWYETQPGKHHDQFLLFKLNIINFLSWMLFAVFGTWLVPWIQVRLSRFAILCGLTVMVLVGSILQGLFEANYYYLFTAAILLSFPEPLLMSNILVWIQNTVREKHQNRCLSLVLMCVYGSGGLGYLVGLLVLPTPVELNQYWMILSIMMGWIILICSTFFLAMYRMSCEEMACKPLNEIETIETTTTDVTTEDSCRQRFRLGVYLFSCAVTSACGIIIPAILAQLFADVGADTETTIIGSIAYGIIPTTVCLPLGLLLDAYPPERWIFWAPFVESILQTAGLVGVFYVSWTPVQLTIWLCVFGLGNTPNMIIYMPAITRVSRHHPKAWLNRMILWCSSVLISLSVLVLLLGSIDLFGPVLVLLSLSTMIVLVCT